MRASARTGEKDRDTHIFSLTHLLVYSLLHSLTYSLAHSHTRKHIVWHILGGVVERAICEYSPHIHTPTLSLTHMAPAYSLSHSLSHTHPHDTYLHTHTHSLSLTHTHTHIYSRTIHGTCLHTLICRWHDTLMYVTWLVHMINDMFASTRDTKGLAARLKARAFWVWCVHMCDMAHPLVPYHIHVWHDSCIWYMTWLAFMCDTGSFAAYLKFFRVWRIYMCDMAHPMVTGRIYLCDVTRAYDLWHDLHSCVKQGVSPRALKRLGGDLCVEVLLLLLPVLILRYIFILKCIYV